MISCRPDCASLLSLSIRGNDMHSLVETLVVTGTSVQQLEMADLGNGKDLLAAASPSASLGHALTMKISVEGRDCDSHQMYKAANFFCTFSKQHLVAS